MSSLFRLKKALSLWMTIWVSTEGSGHSNWTAFKQKENPVARLGNQA
jgi:hypothetical protein